MTRTALLGRAVATRVQFEPGRVAARINHRLNAASTWSLLAHALRRRRQSKIVPSTVGRQLRRPGAQKGTANDAENVYGQSWDRVTDNLPNNCPTTDVQSSPPTVVLIVAICSTSCRSCSSRVISDGRSTDRLLGEV